MDIATVELMPRSVADEWWPAAIEEAIAEASLLGARKHGIDCSLLAEYANAAALKRRGIEKKWYGDQHS
jgi:hypothetical protein